MSRVTLRSIVAFVAVLFVAHGSPIRTGVSVAAQSRPTIVVLATGGTIAGAATTNVQAGYTSGQVGVQRRAYSPGT